MRLALLVLAATVLACTTGAPGGDAQQPDAPHPREARAVEFPGADGATLYGLLFGPADAAGVIVMAHEPGGSMNDWVDLCVAAAEQQMAALTFDLRPQEGQESARAADVVADLEAAVTFVRQEGYAQVGLAGASDSGAAALLLAATDDVAAVAALSPPARLGERGVRPRRISEPVLLVTAREDEPFRRQAGRLGRRLPVVAELDVPGAAHGTDILSEHPAVVGDVVSFFSEHLAGAGAATEPGAPAQPAAPAEETAAPQPVAPPGG